MTVYSKKFKVKSANRIPTFHNVTIKVKEILAESKVKNGILVVYSQHTSCSVMIQEYAHDRNFWGTEFLMQDLVNVMEKVVPTCKTEGQYLHPGPEHLVFSTEVAHDEKRFCLNTDAHLRSVIFGRSESIPVNEGELVLGEFGHVYLVDWDQCRERERYVWVQIVGE